jgi:hypothetical protein
MGEGSQDGGTVDFCGNVEKSVNLLELPDCNACFSTSIPLSFRCSGVRIGPHPSLAGSLLGWSDAGQKRATRYQ